MLTGPYARYGTIVLGVLLVIYAIIGLNKFTFHVARRERKMGRRHRRPRSPA